MEIKLTPNIETPAIIVVHSTRTNSNYVLASVYLDSYTSNILWVYNNADYLEILAIETFDDTEPMLARKKELESQYKN